jgi:hypothetical protein
LNEIGIEKSGSGIIGNDSRNILENTSEGINHPDGLGDYGRAETLHGSRKKARGGYDLADPENKVMIEYINTGAPFTAFSLTKKRPQNDE